MTMSKFKPGDRVRLNYNVPAHVPLARNRPRRVLKAEYDQRYQRTMYILGSNSRGDCIGFPRKVGFTYYRFNSWQLDAYTPRPYRGKVVRRPTPLPDPRYGLEPLTIDYTREFDIMSGQVKNLKEMTSKVVHLPSRYAPATRCGHSTTLGSYSVWYRTDKPATCKKCLKANSCQVQENAP